MTPPRKPGTQKNNQANKTGKPKHSKSREASKSREVSKKQSTAKGKPYPKSNKSTKTTKPASSEKSAKPANSTRPAKTTRPGRPAKSRKPVSRQKGNKYAGGETFSQSGQQDSNNIRLNKLLAKHGLCSRRKADEWIEMGRVSVDGMVTRELGLQIDPDEQTVAVDGVPLKSAPPKTYLALNKPKGVVTTRRDPQGRPIVTDLIPPKIKKFGLFPVGRLDADSEGLIILTNDGDWSQTLLHPKHQVWKEYHVRCDKPLNAEAKNKLEKGVLIEGQKTLPAQVSLPPDKPQSKQFRISIREGRKRQIRLMCKKVGLQVVSLKRVSMGPIRLGKLQPGETRPLTQAEINAVMELE